MKKFLLSTLTILCCCLSSYAAGNDYNIQFCGQEVGGWAGYNKECDVRAYIYIPADKASQLAGNKITGFTFSVVLENGQNASASTPGTVFVSEDLTKDPVVSMSVTFKDAYNTAGYMQTAALSKTKQYEIKEGVGFYFGYTIHLRPGDMIGYDKMVANEQYSGFVEVTYPGEEPTVIEGKNAFEGQDGLFHNLFLSAKTVGNSAMSDQFQIGKFQLGTWDLPTFDKEHALPMRVYCKNTGSTPITNAEYSYWFGESETTSATATLNLPAGEEGWIELPVNYIEGRSNVTVRLEKVNGISVGLIGGGDFFYLGDKGYPGKFVIEKGTGTWCGYCPEGIYMFDQMQTNHPEDFVGIAVHSDDQFTVPAYGALLGWFNGYPECVINRMTKYRAIGVNAEYIEGIYQMWKGQMCNGNIELEVVSNNNGIDITSHTNFAVNDDHSYKIVYVICENDLFGMQSNYFSGDKSATHVGDWNKKGSSVKWYYTHTSRAVKDVWGYAGSNIKEPRAGEVYDCTVNFSPRCISSDGAGGYNFQNGYVVALLIDSLTGEIVTAKNAALVEGGTDGTTGVEMETIDNAGGEAQYFNLQGLKIEKPSKGQLYIKVQDGKTSKIIF